MEYDPDFAKLVVPWFFEVATELEKVASQYPEIDSCLIELIIEDMIGYYRDTPRPEVRSGGQVTDYDGQSRPAFVAVWFSKDHYVMAEDTGLITMVRWNHISKIDVSSKSNKFLIGSESKS